MLLRSRSVVVRMCFALLAVLLCTATSDAAPRGRARVCNPCSPPYSSCPPSPIGPVDSCAQCAWATQDIDPVTAGVQTRTWHFDNWILPRLAADQQGSRVSQQVAERVRRAVDKHKTDKNVNATQGSYKDKCNDFLIRGATQLSSSADSDQGWIEVSEKLEQGH